MYRDNPASSGSWQPSPGDAPAVRIAIVGEHQEEFPPLAATETAVESTAGRPLLGTCAGFQHMVLELARNVLGWEEAVSEQYSPAGRQRVVHRLECVVRGKELSLRLEAGSRVASLYGASTVSERYFCTFGLNPDYRESIVAAGLEASGVDATSGEVRVVERGGPGFFLGTLFVPQMRTTALAPHPVVTGFLRAAAAELP